MTHTSKFSCALLWILSVAIGPLWPQPQRLANHVVLISIDGLRPEFYLDARWPAPRIRQMADAGVHAKSVRGVFPTVTYPSHTTMLTGALPAGHGIYYNTPFEPGGQTGRWYWEESFIRIPTLWDALRQAGLQSAGIAWPASVGAPIDRNIPEYWSLEQTGDPLQALREVTAPSNLWVEIETMATGRLTATNFTSEHMTRDDHVAMAAAYLLETYRPGLLTVHLLATDEFQHQAGREAPIVERAVATVDRSVSQIVEAAERAGIAQRTAFIITGDHGFINVHTALAPNVWLAKAGLMEAKANRGRWRATFHSAGGSAFLHLKDPGDVAALDRVRELLAGQPRKYRRLFEIIEQEELRRLGADPSAALALDGIAGVHFTSSPSGPVLRESKGGTHGFHPDRAQILTGFIGWGAGFQSGRSADRLGLEDVAPIIAYLLGLSFDAPDGVVPRGLVEPQP